MQNSNYATKIKFSIIILFFVIFATGCNQRYYNTAQTGLINIAQDNENSMEPIKPEIWNQNGIELTINYGFNHYAKFGKYMNVRGNITSLENDFQGVLQIIIPEHNGNHVVYEEKVKVSKGVTKHITMDIPMNGSYGEFQYKLLDEQNSSIVEKTTAIEYVINPQIKYIGVLSDEMTGLSYLQEADTKAFYLEEDAITDNYLSLDSLDIIIISDYDMKKLSKNQCSAIKEWVKSGGTLVLSADDKSRIVLKEFLGDSLLKVEENTVSSYITFQFDSKDPFNTVRVNNGNSVEMLNQTMDFSSYTQIAPYKSIEKELYNIYITDSKSIEIGMVNSENTQLLQAVDLGLGKIQVFSFDLKLEEKDQEMVGQRIHNSIIQNLSKVKNQQLNNGESYNPYDYRILNNIELTGDENLPKVTKYIIILLIYIVIIGPIVYFVLKKKEKRNLTWIVVPGISAIFTVIIFFMGSSTRVEEPYIGYATMIQMEENGLAESNTIFSVTSPYNKPYSITFPNTSFVSAVVDRFSYGNNYYNNKVDYNKYNITLSRESENTKIEIKDHSAFSPVYFTTQSKVLINGTYEFNIYDTNNAVTGTFTNNMGFPLYHTALLCNGVLFHIGELADGKTVNLDNLEQEEIPTPENLYTSKLINKIAGGKADGSNIDGVRRHNILESYMEKAVRGSEKSNFLIGFIEDSSYDFFDTINYKSFGVKSMIIPIEPNQTKDGLTYINDMSMNMEVVDGYYDSTYRYVSGEDLIVKYSFQIKDRIKSITYGKRGNLEFFDKNQGVFKGKAYFYNYNTSQYDLIFTSGQEKQITELSNYLNNKNELLMKVKVKKDAESTNAITLPMLTAVKEAD